MTVVGARIKDGGAPPCSSSPPRSHLDAQDRAGDEENRDPRRRCAVALQAILDPHAAHRPRGRAFEVKAIGRWIMDAQLINGLNAMYDGIDTGFDDISACGAHREARYETNDELDRLIGECERGWIN